MNLWLASEDQWLRDLAKAGEPGRVIAEKLGKTRSAVMGRAKRLGVQLQGRPFGMNKEGQRYVRPAPSPKPILVPACNEKQLIADAIASGKVRRFEARAGADYYSLQQWLRDRGYHLAMRQSLYSLSSGRGRPKMLKWGEVITFVDDLRTREGLQPLRVAA